MKMINYPSGSRERMRSRYQKERRGEYGILVKRCLISLTRKNLGLIVSEVTVLEGHEYWEVSKGSVGLILGQRNVPTVAGCSSPGWMENLE